MNETLALPEGLGLSNSSGVLGFPASISERSAKQLPQSASELMRAVSSILDDLIFSALEKRTAVEFISMRSSLFPKYLEAVLACSALARLVLPVHMLNRLSLEFFCEAEADFRERGLAAFGSEVRDQAVFTVWTLKKIHEICRRINEGPDLGHDLKDAERDLKKSFIENSVWTRFHLDCLTKSMETNQPVYPEVLELLVDGLRAAVNAYAWARRGLDLRFPSVEPETSPIEWDDDEQQLLDESTFDAVVNESL